MPAGKGIELHDFELPLVAALILFDFAVLPLSDIRYSNRLYATHRKARDCIQTHPGLLRKASQLGVLDI